MCRPRERKRFISVFTRKFNALKRYVSEESTKEAALKTAEMLTCVNRDEVFN